MHRMLLFPVLFLITVPTQRCLAIDVFILAGQSNAVGYGGNADDLPSELQIPRDDIRFWYDIGSREFPPGDDQHVRPLEGTDAWVTLRPQVEAPRAGAFDNAWVGLTGQDIYTGHGPELSLGRRLAESWENDVAIIKFAWGNTALDAQANLLDWNTSSGEFYQWLIDEVDLAMNKLNSEYDLAGDIKALFWMQGGSDTLSDAYLRYETNLTSFFEAIRRNWGSELCIVSTQLPKDLSKFSHPWYGSISETAVTGVREAQTAVAARNPLNFLVDLDDIPMARDNAHFLSAGYLEIGERLATAYLDLVQPPLLGDYNGNRILDVEDLDILTIQSASGTGLPVHDLNLDGLVDAQDVEFWAKSKDIGYTWIGDANCDGQFNTGDLVQVLNVGKYELKVEAENVRLN